MPSLSCSRQDLWSSWQNMGSRSLTRVKPRPPALGAWSLNHWTTREVPSDPVIPSFLIFYSLQKGLSKLQALQNLDPSISITYFHLFWREQSEGKVKRELSKCSVFQWYSGSRTLDISLCICSSWRELSKIPITSYSPPLDSTSSAWAHRLKEEEEF